MDGTSPTARRAAIVALLGTLAALVVALDAPLCPSATLLGIPCPGCGLTRASLALVRGDLGAALGFHPLAPLLTPLVAAMLALAVVRFVLGERALAWLPHLPARLTNAAAGALVALLLGVWIARFLGAFGGPVPVKAFPGAPFQKHTARPAFTR